MIKKKGGKKRGIEGLVRVSLHTVNEINHLPRRIFFFLYFYSNVFIFLFVLSNEIRYFYSATDRKKAHAHAHANPYEATHVAGNFNDLSCRVLIFIIYHLSHARCKFDRNRFCRAEQINKSFFAKNAYLRGMAIK